MMTLTEREFTEPKCTNSVTNVSSSKYGKYLKWLTYGAETLFIVRDARNTRKRSNCLYLQNVSVSL